MKKINKEFEERCIKLKNRIQRLKDEEEDYRKRLRNHMRREEQDKLIKNEKEKLKLEIQKNKDELNRALYNKRNFIKQQKENNIKYREERKNANYSQKKFNYKNILTDKIINKVIREQLKEQQRNKNAYSHAKIRQELNEFEANRKKKTIERENILRIQHENNIHQLKELEKEMKSTCNKLEIIEKEYLDKLNRTKHNVKLLGDSKSFNYNTKLRKNRYLVNKSKHDINTNGMGRNQNDSEYKNRNRSAIDLNRSLNQTYKNKKNINISKISKNKKNNNLISINYYPKTIRAKSSNKIILNNNNSIMGNKEKEKKSE